MAEIGGGGKVEVIIGIRGSGDGVEVGGLRGKWLG
jgi:hypothetical protein